ncbi:transcriptional regulator [Sphingomonas sp. Leaf34]|nr:transcriptional regulator [Sphingomonas sp. Leaf38]KQN32200.1 transcriptional regulator [Sphingomonas sp. Leaf34]
MTPPVTIKDVARAAGVSPKTVSRVMNAEAHVRPAVRDHVLRVVAELGYRPNAYARSLSSSRSYLIGLFFDDPASGYAAEVQLGAMARCRHHGYHLVVERIDRDAPAPLDEVARTLQALQLAGVILTPPIGDWSDLTDLLEQRGIPVVKLNSSQTGASAAVIHIDDYQAARDMTEHLIMLGHRDIAFVQGIVSHDAAGKRLAGFRDAMRCAGIDIREAWIQAGDFSFRSGIAAGDAILSTEDRPSAVFAANDEMALGVLVSAARRNIAVPKALSVVGFDDAPIARMAWPQLTTIRQPNAVLAGVAIDILADPAYQQAGDRPARSVQVPYSFIGRSSSGPAQGAKTGQPTAA